MKWTLTIWDAHARTKDVRLPSLKQAASLLDTMLATQPRIAMGAPRMLTLRRYGDAGLNRRYVWDGSYGTWRHETNMTPDNELFARFNP